MTSPEDDGLEEALRRALSEAANEVEPGTDGLDRIRARIGDRPPRPWLFSVLTGLVDRVRNWTWRGHWAWQDSLPGLRSLRERRSRRNNFPGWGIGWLRLVTAVGGVAVLAGIALGVQPFRHAILQAGDSLNGNGASPSGSAGTEGNGIRAGGATPMADGVSSSGGQTGMTVTGKSQAATPHPSSSARCMSTTLPVLAGAKPTQTSAAPGASATATATTVASSAGSGSAGSGSATSAEPVYTDSTAPACPVAPATKTPTPTPSSSSAAPIPTSSGTSPTQWAPNETSPTPTPTYTSPTSDPPTPGPSDRPSWAGRRSPEGRYQATADRHRSHQ